MKRIKGISNSDIYIEGEGIKKVSLEINQDTISQIGDGKENNPDYLSVPEGYFVLPGLVDEHIHGAKNADARDATGEALKTIADAEAEDGTTTFSFTTRTRDNRHIEAALTAINEYRRNQTGKSRVMGIHLEGPFISKKFCGAQNEEDIVPLNASLLMHYDELSGHHIKEVTFSYDPNHKDFLEYRVSHRIAASIGHTDNTCALALEAIKNGVTIGTHTFNARTGIKHRERGTAGALRISDSVSCELIADFHHVCRECIEMRYRCKGKDKITLITDSREAKGRPNGTYQLGGQKVYVKDGAARLLDGTLAGSILHLNEAVRNRKNLLSLSLEDAVDRASKNPAKNRGLYDQIGSIKAGKKADFVIADKDRNIWATIVGGEIVYQK